MHTKRYSSESDESDDSETSLMNLTLVNANKHKFCENTVVLDSGNSMNVFNNEEWFFNTQEIGQEDWFRHRQW